MSQQRPTWLIEGWLPIAEVGAETQRERGGGFIKGSRRPDAAAAWSPEAGKSEHGTLPRPSSRPRTR